MYSIHTYFRILLVILTCTINLFAQNNWQILSSPTTELLRNLTALDENHVWAAGTNGTIVRTTNGGEDWELLNSGITTAIYDIYFLNEDLGWAVTFPFDPPYFTGILSTTDGGDNWSVKQYPEEFIQFRTIYFLDSLNGYIGGARIEKTTDAGNTWHRVEVDSSEVSDYPVIKIKFYDQQLGYASGGSRDHAGVMWRTSNSGWNWTAVSISPDETYDFYIKDSSTVITLSGDPEFIFPTVLAITIDAGLNWTSTNLPYFSLSFGIDFRTESEGWSASGNEFMYSSDGGNTWSVKPTPENTAVTALQFVNDTIGFASGEQGVLLKYVGSTVNVDDEPVKPAEFRLLQNYPNPFNPVTTITGVLSSASYSKLIVYDVLGNEIAVLLDEYLPAGKFQKEFYADELTSGIYFYKLIAGEFTQTKKMILLR